MSRCVVFGNVVLLYFCKCESLCGLTDVLLRHCDFWINTFFFSRRDGVKVFQFELPEGQIERFENRFREAKKAIGRPAFPTARPDAGQSLLRRFPLLLCHRHACFSPASLAVQLRLLPIQKPARWRFDSTCGSFSGLLAAKVIRRAYRYQPDLQVYISFCAMRVSGYCVWLRNATAMIFFYDRHCLQWVAWKFTRATAAKYNRI